MGPAEPRRAVCSLPRPMLLAAVAGWTVWLLLVRACALMLLGSHGGAHRKTAARCA